MIVIQGSSRSHGNTRKVSDFMLSFSGSKFIDLWSYKLNEFSYEGMGNDDFQDIISEIVKHDVIILVTPIYWYTMSARMKIFFDRITDLLKWNKELGRKIRGKKMVVISSSMHDDAPEHFDYPFRMSADYLGMDFVGYCHTWIHNDELSELTKSRLRKLLTKVEN